MRIFALTRYSEIAAATRQRFAQYRPYLAENGIELVIAPLLPDAHLTGLNEGRRSRSAAPRAYLARLATLLRRRDFDLLWVQYELFPYLPGWIERLAFISGKPVVVDYDDAIFHLYDAHRKGIVRRLLGRKLEPLLSGAAAVVCGNRYLQDYAARFCPNTILVPTVVDTDSYVPAPQRHSDPSSLTVGWIGSPTTWVNVEPLLPAILRTIAPFGARMRAIGPGSSATPHEGLDIVPWSEDREVAEVQSFDIGIMPLLDHLFQRGKCGYKLIQYMACGVPTIASPVGVNTEIVIPGEDGYLATTEEEWTKALRSLLSDPDLRARMGRAGRQRAEALYSLRIQQPRLLELFRSLSSRKG